MHVVVTFTGRDRPGVVHRLAAVVRDHGANWEESRMAHLAGRFAGILELRVPTGGLVALRAELEALAGEDLRILVDAGEEGPEPPVARRMRLTCTGNDRLGIVRDLSAILVEHGVNILDLSTSAEEAPMSGGFVFRAAATIDLPETLARPTLRRALERLGDDLLVELTELFASP